MNEAELLEEEADRILVTEDVLFFLINLLETHHKGDLEGKLLLILSGLSSGFQDKRKTIHVITVGGSGKGKSHLQEAVSYLFERVDNINSTSAKALLYRTKAEKEEDKLINKGIIKLDESEDSEVLKALERALTDDTLTPIKHISVDKDKKSTSFIIREINAIWKNQVSTPEDEQTLNRYLIYNVDESEEQDQAVFKRIIQEYCYNDFIDTNSRDFKLAKIITNKIEERINIIIPYGDFLESSDINNRRSTPKFLKLLELITYAYRFRRPKLIDKNNNTFIFSTLIDFKIASLLWRKLNRYEITHLNQKELLLFNIIPKGEKNAVDRQELANKLNVHTDTVSNWIGKLIDNGLINYKEERIITKKYYYWTTKEYEGLRITLNTNKLTLEALRTRISRTTKKYNIIIDNSELNQILN